MSEWLKKLEDTASRDLGTVMRWFGSDHLQTAGRVVAEVESVAGVVAGLLPDGPELKAGLAFLRTAQDKFLLAAEAAYSAVQNQSGVTVTTAPEPSSAPMAAPPVPAPIVVPEPVAVAAPPADDSDASDSPAGGQVAALDQTDTEPDATPDAGTPALIPGRDHPISEPPPQS